MDTLQELDSFCKQFIQYQRLVRDNLYNPIPIHQAREIDDLRYELQVGYSRLEKEITRYGGRNIVVIDPIFGKKGDVFQYALETINILDSTNKLNAIDKSISILNKVIGKLETEGVTWGVEKNKVKHKKEPQKPKAFISHGKGEGALLKLERFLIELGVQSIIVKDQPNLDRTVDKKVEDCLDEADFVIILATGDDKVGNKLQPRQNVIHEIGLAQKTHPGKIIYLLEEGTELPSNIRPKVYETFARQSMDRAFTAIIREIKKLGFL